MTTTVIDYGVFTPITQGQPITMFTKDITKENINDHVSNLKDVFLDFIEVPEVQNNRITFVFDNGMEVKLPPAYALINLIVWGFIVNTNQTIKPQHVFFNKKGITNGYIKSYIDKYCIIPVREQVSSDNDRMIIHNLNRTIYDSLRGLKFVDKFAWYFNNSINLEDFVLMYNNCPGFKQIMDRHNSGYYTKFGSNAEHNMNDEALDDMNRLIDYIVNAKKYIGRDHCLSDAFRSKEGIKPKQAREVLVNIGMKPNGEGGIFPYVVNTSYISGGANNVAFHILESLVARIAQILSKKNTSRSGHFSRIMILNCSDTRKYTMPYSDKIDPGYDCGTRNFLEYYVEDETALKKIADRWYRLHPMGMEYRLTNNYNIVKESSDLIGKVIYLRSPIKCLSAAHGKGICRKCMGELYNIVPATNISTYSVTNVTEPLTQMMLSAKHLLEAKIDGITFDTSVISEEMLNSLIIAEEGTVYINPNIPDAKKWHLVINADDIQEDMIASLDNSGDEDLEDVSIGEDMLNYTNVFYLKKTNSNESIMIKTTDMDNLNFTDWLNKYVEAKNFINNNEDIDIPVTTLIEENVPLFDVGVHNDDMSERLESVIKVIDLKANTDSYTAETFLSTLSNKLNSIGLGHIMSVHLEIIIMNQIRSSEDIIEMPDWSVPNQTNYQILTLKKAVMTHPSISISMQSENIAKMLHAPLTLRKHIPSSYDLMYMVQPQKFLHEDPVEKTEDYSSKLFAWQGDKA
jgi:hypothetical protein